MIGGFTPQLPRWGAGKTANKQKVPLGGFSGGPREKKTKNNSSCGSTSIFIKQISILFFLSIVYQCAGGQTPDYPEIFGNDWKKAEDFVGSNREWLETALKKYDISYSEAVAVVFPELVRYSALRDKMEITLLKTLYINLGKDYANFSIGHFQMKPVFAERIREMASGLPSRRLRNMLSDSADYQDIRNYRSSIVSDLENIRTQINYLVLFIKICYRNFNLEEMDEESRIKFLAAAFNAGFYKTETEINSMIDTRYFSTRLFGKDLYSYSDISFFWYNQNH